MNRLLPSFILLNLLFISCTEKTASNTTPVIETEFAKEVYYHQCESILEIYNIETKQRRIVYQSNEHFEAPNWVHHGNYLIFNQNGKLYKINVKGGIPELINTAFADNNNNDHGISPDGTQLVISNYIDSTHTSMMYTLPIEGGTPTQIVTKGQSYWHGWSPDGNTLAYCANRNNNYDIYTIPILGGQETRLTTAEGLDDGPDYTYDGKYIYFNSVRSGNMKIWRMKSDGSEQEQMTFDACNDWFVHPSPDGKWAVMVTYISKVEPGSHPGNKNICLRMMPLHGGQPEILFNLFGGQGTINVPSWSADSKEFAFVSYRKKK